MNVTLSLEGGNLDLAVRSHRFTEAGGVVGRDPAADWVLPDKRNVVSGQHFRIGFDAQRFNVTDTSRNGTHLNGRPIGTNQTRPLADGDRLRIGDYEFSAKVGDVATFPMAVRDDGSFGAMAGSMAGALVDPETPSARDTDPLAHLAAAPPRPASYAAAAPRPLAAGRFGGDDDLAGLFDDTPGQPDTASLIDHAPPPPALPPPPAPPLQATIIPLPLPPQPVPEPDLEPRLDAAVDSVPKAAPLIPDDWAPDFGLLSPQPAPIDLSTFLLQPLPPTPPPPIPLRPAPQPDPDATPTQDAATLLQRREAARNAPAQAPAPAPAPGTPAGNEAAELLAILWTSLGVDPARLSPKDRQRFLGELGLAMREMSDGLIGVLGMRQNIKSEFRMERTMVGSTENNLFKFTRNADELLALAVSNANKVFLPLDRAVRGAFNDIKAHELSTLSAVQLSIRSLLDRFNPAKIEKQAQEKRKGFSFGSLKATCWEHFSEDYGSLAGDADEASNRIFATELARAYRERTQKQPDA